MPGFLKFRHFPVLIHTKKREIKTWNRQSHLASEIIIMSLPGTFALDLFEVTSGPSCSPTELNSLALERLPLRTFAGRTYRR